MLKVDTVTMIGVHPCTYVTEDVNVCILDEGETPNKENCWNEQNCKNRRTLDKFGENDSTENVVTADSAPTFYSAILMTVALIVIF